MLKMINKKFPSGKVGDNIKIHVPDVDRGKCASRNIIGVIAEFNNEKELYKIGRQYGTINTVCSQFDIQLTLYYAVSRTFAMSNKIFSPVVISYGRLS